MPGTPTKKGISRAEVARLENVERSTVGAWEKNGWLVQWPDHSVDYEATMIRVKACRKGSGGDHRSNKKAIRARAPEVGIPIVVESAAHAEELFAAPPAIPANDEQPIDEYRRRRAYWDAEKSRLDALETGGKLIDLKKASRLYSDEIRSLRTRTMTIPDQMPDAATREMVRRLLTDAWAEMSDRPPELP